MKALALSVALGALCGCGDPGQLGRSVVAPSDVTTHGMALDFKVTSDGSGSHVYAAVHVGDWNSNTFASLDKGDVLTLHVTGQPDRGMQINQDGQKTYYTADVPTASGDFTVDFVRVTGASAIGNVITLPLPFTLTGPSATISRKAPLTVSWTPTDSASSVRVKVHGDCIFDKEDSVIGDPGTFTFNGGDLSPLAGHENDVCPLALTVTRFRMGGQFSSELGHPSQGDAEQYRTMTVQSGA